MPRQRPVAAGAPGPTVTAPPKPAIPPRCRSPRHEHAMTVLVTGAAGFIGMHVAEALLARGDTVLGFDNLNPYYDVALKRARIERLGRHRNFRFELLDIADGAALRAMVRQ